MPNRLFQVAVRHPGLNAYRVISGTDWYTVNMKARVQYDAWEHEWRKRQGVDMRRSAEADARRRAERERQERSRRKCREWAASQTAEARATIDAVRSTLARALAVHDAVEWDALVDRTEFRKPRPERPSVKPPPDVPSPGDPPNESLRAYKPSIGMFDRLSSSRRESKIAEAEARLEADRKRWADAVVAARAARESGESRYQSELARVERDHSAKLAEWEREHAGFIAAQRERNDALHDRKRRYEASEPDAVVQYCHMVLARSDYPDAYPRGVAVEYVDETRSVVVDFTLPPIERLPDVKEVTYDEASGQFGVVRLSGAERAELHESLLYQIPLRTAHELFEADVVGAVRAVAFNGWIRPGGGEPERCVASLLVDRSALAAIDLSTVDPKACFRALGGVGWSAHYNLEAVAPIVDTPRARGDAESDARPTSSLYGGFGLDEMSVEDFEHLTRELLEREVAAADERVSIARVGGGVDALILTAARRVRVLVHARMAKAAATPDAFRVLRESAAAERAPEAVFISTGDAGATGRDLAGSLGITLVDGPRLLNLLARNAGRIGVDLRGTSELQRGTSEFPPEHAAEA